jgi:phytoene dehydrogenase-like protein
MTDFDAIVVGAGHNGLTAAALLQKAGLRTLCLDSKLYAGGMASTVELFDGFKFEIAGSVQIPTSATVSRELGLDDLPTVDLDVMSVSLRGVGDEPLVYYTDPMKLLTHINEVHGAEAVNGMAGLMAWCQAPTRALGRFDAGQPPKTLDEMYACATNEFASSTITDLLFGSARDVLDRYVPDQEKNGALQGMLVAAHATPPTAGPRLPATPRRWPTGCRPGRERAAVGSCQRWHVGTTSHLCEVFTSNGGELRLRSKVDEITVADGGSTGSASRTVPR